MLLAILCLVPLTLMCGVLLGWAAVRFHAEDDACTAKVLDLLPGTQCGQCGFAGCSQAAEALVAGKAPATLCPPGGSAVARAVGEALGISVDVADDVPKVARIDDSVCIGCTKCFRECPTDAVIGAPKQIHYVLEEYCTGCRRCVDACPTETIQLVVPGDTIDSWRWPRPDAA